ncbi:putative structural maintenance of chromosomes protein [Trypoxylus dichotomus]
MLGEMRNNGYLLKFTTFICHKKLREERKVCCLLHIKRDYFTNQCLLIKTEDITFSSYYQMATHRSSLKRAHPDDEIDGDDSEHINFSDEEGGVRIDDIYIPPAPKPVCSTSDTGPRLIITQIVNEWFKSYAGGQKVGPFHKRFNAIIGPNGSGKSNVIDSMLFVFGYRATKIRCKKVSTLLHNTDKYKNVQSATVSIYFAQITDMEGDEYKIVPDSEFVISRTANKDNSSFYQLNKKRVQFKEIAVVLRKHGVDLDHNRFLILQGEVEQIAMMKSKATNEHETGMLEYLEDIIGTSRYKEPLEKLLDRVESLTERRTEKLNRLKLIESDINELKGPMEEAVEYLKLENTITKNKNILYQKKLCDLQSKKETNDKEKDTIVAEQKEFINKINTINENKKKHESVYNTCLTSYEDLRKKKDMLKDAFEKANTKDYQLQTNMQQTNMSRKKFKQQLITENKKLNELEHLPEKSVQDLKQLHNKEKQLTAQKEKLEADKEQLISTLNEDTKALREKRQELEPKLADLKSVVLETQSSFQLAESKLKMYKKNEDDERRKFESLAEAHEIAEKNVIEYTESIKTLKNKIPLTERSLQEAMRQLDAAQTKQKVLENDRRQCWTNLENYRSSMQASRSRGRVLDSLMQQKLEGQCPGFFGRLGDLGAIDKKYDVAISTACGPLDNIVVDTVDTAQWCIEFLKAHNLGRATFIALDKQERFREAANSKIRTPENVFRLYDLVKVNDERVKTAFYYALRDTLVADNLEQASRVAYGAQRFRVVTLQGSLIEISGVMSGGGNRVSRGRMGQSVAVSDTNPEDVKIMESDLEKLEETIQENNKQCVLLEKQVATLRPELEKMKLDLRKYTTELESSKRQKPILQRELKELKKRVSATRADPEEVKRLEIVIQEKRAAFETASTNASTYQKDVDIITEQINERMTGRVKVIDKNINDVNKSMTKVKAEITRINVAVKTSERNLAKCKEKITSLQEEITNAEESLKAMNSEKQEIESDGKQLLACIDQIVTQIMEKEDELSEMKQEIAEFSKQEKGMKSSKIEVDHRLDKLNKLINEINAQMHEWQIRKNSLKLNKIPFSTSTEIETLKIFTLDELQEKDYTLLNNELHAQEQMQKNCKPNLKVIKDYEMKQQVYLERFKELEEVTKQRNDMHNMYESLRNRRKNEFLDGYEIIRKKLKEMYQMITLGGDADFELVDNFDPFTEGVQFNVRPPKKSWKIISNLSGGEKTLSSLALVFALHYYKPSPLYFMDEIDAALDFKNVSIVGHYIKERAKNAQFIIISLRPNMFELADHLVGIFKTNNCTSSITIKPRSFETTSEEAAEQEQNQPNEIVLGKDIANQNNVENQDANERTDESELSHTTSNDSDDQVIDDSFESQMDTSN